MNDWGNTDTPEKYKERLVEALKEIKEIEDLKEVVDQEIYGWAKEIRQGWMSKEEADPYFQILYEESKNKETQIKQEKEVKDKITKLWKERE